MSYLFALNSLPRRKPCLVGLKISSILHGKKFSSPKSNELIDQQDMFCLKRASAFNTNKIIMKMLKNNEFKAQTSTGNPIGNARCHVLMSCALNISRSFGHSAGSIESRCVVKRNGQAMIMKVVSISQWQMKIYYHWLKALEFHTRFKHGFKIMSEKQFSCHISRRKNRQEMDTAVFILWPTIVLFVML